MAAHDPVQRHLVAKLAAHARWARGSDPVAATAAAREARWQQYLVRVDPDGVLPERERIRRATAARRADLARMALERERGRRERLLTELFGGDDEFVGGIA